MHCGKCTAERMSRQRKTGMIKHYLYSIFRCLNTLSCVGAIRFVVMHITGRKVLLSGACRNCGKCCRRINLEAAGGWVRSEEVFEGIVRDYPEYSRFSIIGPDSQGFLLFSCSWCTPEGLCRDYENRLSICRNFPDSSLVFCGGSLPEECGYRLTTGVPFAKVLEKEQRKLK